MNNRMKKIVGVAAAAVMMVAMSATVFAANSPVASGTVNKVSAATDKDGNAVNVTFSAIPEEYKAEAEAIKSVDKVKEVLGSAFVEGMKVVDVQEVSVPEGTVFPVTITFEVPGVTENTKVAILHFNTENNAWEPITCKAGKGTITATFESLSPVAFVVDQNTAASTTSPKTGETNAVPFAAAGAVVLLAGAALCFRKKACF